MHTTDFDRLLDSMAEPLSRPAEEEARRVAVATMPPRLRRGQAPRPRWLIPVIVGGAIALTAGAGTAVITMSHWGGVSMPLDNVRNNDPIPVSWTTETGHHEECRVWIELRNAAPGDRAILDAAIVAHDWSGVGQQLYDAEPRSDDPEGERRVGDGLEPVIRTFIGETFPGIHWMGGQDSADLRVVDAWGMTCAPETK